MRQRGFTLRELAVVVTLGAVTTGLILNRVLPLIGRAERTAFFKLESELRSALLIEAATRIARGESATLTALAGTDPIRLLPSPPGNYVQEMPAASPRTWHFDDSRGVLVYRVGRHNRFEALDGPKDRIELAVTFLYSDNDDDGAFEPSIDEFHRLELAAVNAYHWPDD